MKIFFFCALMLLVAMPCEAQKKQNPVGKTPQEIKAMTSKQYEEPKKLIFRASITMLQSEGFLIDDTNLEVGLIKASKRIEADKRTAQGRLIWKGKAVDASFAKFMIIIDELNENLSDIRVTIYDGVEMTIAGLFGSRRNKNSDEMVLDAEVYNSWFNSLNAEIERLKAIQ